MAERSVGAIERMEGWAEPYQDYLVETGEVYGGSLRVKSPDWI